MNPSGPTPAETAIRRQTLVRLAIAALLLALAALFWWLRPPPDMGQDRSDAIAALLFERYVKETGEPAEHYEGPRRVAYQDGREYRWIYVPCADIAELRIFISRRGGASFTLTPDCTPTRGFAVAP